MLISVWTTSPCFRGIPPLTMQTGILLRRFFCASLFVSSALGATWAQNLTPTSCDTPRSNAITVPEGTPLPIVLDKEVRLRKVGQPIRGKIASLCTHSISSLFPPAARSQAKSSPSRESRFKSALSPPWTQIFRHLARCKSASDGFDIARRQARALQTIVSPASRGVLQFAAAADPANQNKLAKKTQAKKLASSKVSEARQEISRNWETAKQQVNASGKVHRLERYAVAQLPYHPQYLDAGMRYNAELKQPLDFGNESLSADLMQSFGSTPPAGSVVHALLVTPLSSATAQKADNVEAVITAPLLAENHLIFPEGTRLKGSVLQVRPARMLKRNGQLRIVFHQVIPPNAAQQTVEASLEGVEVKDQEHLTLDSEGGAQVTTSKTRYLATGISVALAASSFSRDADADRSFQQSDGELGGRVVNGASGFKVIGIVLGVAVHSRAFASGMGIYGAGMSVYTHFLARGRDVVYPKDTAMAIGFGTRVTRPTEPKPSL